MRGRGTASIVASPVLVGAVTTLILVVAVFLAYNANQGLPFVPTYDLKAELPHGANLVTGNEVRVGGFRVGIIDQITPRTIEENGRTRSIAVMDMKLDKVVEPLATDTQVLVRPRSALGLKYIELNPGQAPTTFNPGDTIPLANTGPAPIEVDDLFNTFDQGLRDDSRTALQGYGDALAGRGQSINVALQEFPGFFRYLTSVMDVLNDDSTQLDQFFLQIGRAAAQAAPVADVQAQLFTHMADTFEAFSRDPAALQSTIEQAPPTLDASIRSFRVQRPFLADFADLSNRLRPAAQEMPRSLPRIVSAFVVGQDVLPRTVAFNRRVANVFRAIEDLAENPNTLLALQDLRTTMDVTGPLLQGVAPYQTVCNYFNYFFHPLGEHISEPVDGGTIQRVLIKSDPGAESGQDNRIGAKTADRPADVPRSRDPQEEHSDPTAVRPIPEPLVALHGQPYQPAIDGQGRADCQNGQNGYLKGPLIPPNGRYPRRDWDPFDRRPDPGGGTHVVTHPDIPYLSDGGRAGPTFDPNSPDGLGVRRLQDVP